MAQGESLSANDNALLLCPIHFVHNFSANVIPVKIALFFFLLARSSHQKRQKKK